MNIQTDFTAGRDGVCSARTFISYESDADLFPHSGKERAAEYRRIAAATTVQEVCRKIWGHGHGPNAGLEPTIAYFADHFRCTSIEVALAVHDWIAGYFPEGESTDLRAMTDDERRACAAACLRSAAEYERTVRARLKRI